MREEPVGRLVSVNVGLPRDVPWRGRTVHTGIWKTPVSGPQEVGTLNLVGDGQGDLAGHGGPHRAVLVYQTGAYAYWAQHLGRDDLSAGAFGENFTVEGLPDDEVCIGDRWAVGSALFEVSQPRVTCYRLGLRLDEPQLPALVVAHGRPGFYLRVLREGTVRAGDPVRKVGADAEPMTVAQVDALLYRPGRDLREVERALRLRSLSPGWVGSFQALVAMAETPGAVGNAGLTDVAPPPAWSGFRRLRVLDRSVETPSVVSVRLGPVDGRPLPSALPGQFVTVRLTDGRGQRVARSYSLSGPPGPEYRLSVKREDGGVGSALVHDRLPVGAELDVAAPRGRFTLADGTSAVLLLSAGIGVTPVLAMLHALVRSASRRPVWWVHAARNSREHVLADEAQRLLQQLPGAQQVICYSAPLEQDREGVDYTHRGRPTEALLGALGLPAGADAYLCGPQAFLDGMRAALAGLGLDGGAVHVELFGAGPGLAPGIAAASRAAPVRPHPPAGPPGDGPTVAFARSGLSVRWSPRYPSLLELAEACDVPVRWSCRTGVCHTCEVGLLAGRVGYDPEPVDDPAEGNVLICCAAPLEELTVDL